MKKCKKITGVVLLVSLIVFSTVACDYESETGVSSNSTTTAVSTTSKSTSVEETQASTIEDITVASTEATPTEAPATEAATTKKASSTKATTKASSSRTKSSSSAAKVTVPAEAETGSNLVWVPTNGGKKYHSKSSCSGMKDPIQVSKDTAVADGYTPCGKCYK